MELLASGHNAWGQLDFENSNPQNLHDTDDFQEFKSILQGRAIKQVQAFLSYTTCMLFWKGEYSKSHHVFADANSMIGK